MIHNREELTAREREHMDHEKQMFALQAEHTQKVKAMEFESVKVEAKWTNILRVPLAIVRLPLLVVFGVAYCIAMIRDREPTEDFWRIMRP
jgi:hypothetical protein